jgi:mycoredoxin
MMRRWGFAVLLLVCGALPAAASPDVAGFAIAAVLAVLAALVSPLPFPRSIAAAQAQRRSAQDGKAIVYWRPGCPFCLRLRGTLGRTARRAYWVDIWRDPEGAAAVRAVAGGYETVPTVILAGEPHVNPDPRWLKGRLHAA